MKITDENFIKNGEKELINRIYNVVDWNSIKAIFKEKYCINIQDDREYRQGDIVVHNNSVAYDLKFDVRATISVLFDRSGNFLEIKSPSDPGEKLQQAEVSHSDKSQNERSASRFTYVPETEMAEEEDIIELTDIVKEEIEEIIELTDIVMKTKVAA